MKTLAKRDFATPLRFEEGKFKVQWSKGHTEIRQKEGGRVQIKFNGSVHCKQEVTLEKPHVVDHACMVQLDSEEAACLGLKSALGVIEGRKLT